MLNLDEVKNFYDVRLDKNGQFLFKEYLQYLILKIIFDTKVSSKLSFLGGTNLRLVHNNQRFSEDLDFDNFNLSKDEFDALSFVIKEKLELEGFDVEVKNVYKGAFRCYIKIPKILKELGYSDLEEEKILIQIDTVPHGYNYEIETIILNKFGLLFKIHTTPLNILLSQKIWAIFNRPRKKGRDFFDVVYLFSRTAPDYKYLELKLGFKDLQTMKKEILKLCETLNFEELSDDVKPFLINQDEVNRILMFKEFIESL